MKQPLPTLRACPFCGHQPDEENLLDSIHPLGTLNSEYTLWTAGCVDNEGGCNASVTGSSREHAILRWNTRVGDDRTKLDELNRAEAKRFYDSVVLKRVKKATDRDSDLASKLWSDDNVMSLNAELGLTIDQLVRLTKTLAKVKDA